MITTVVALFGSIVAILSLRANSHLARSKNALDFEKSLEDSSVYNTCNKQLASFRDNSNSEPSAILLIAKKPEIDYEVYDAAIELLNWWERGANGIRNKVYRNDVLRKLYCSHFINLSTYLEPFIIERRKQRL
ncbi:MAG: hypothetical protein ACI8WB_002514 [Phenylobacterium sp.]|jgi:hypothetical protein